MAIVISGENGELGEHFKDFEIEYTVTEDTGTEIKVTETLGSSVIRTHTVAGGETQTVIVPVKGLTLGQHTVTITATAGEEAVERAYTFIVPPVWVDCEKTDLGNKVDSFAVAYVPGSYGGEEIAVTEYLDGKEQRTYTSASGEMQSMIIDMRSVPDGEHRVSLTAVCGEDTTTVILTFWAATITTHEGGSVQELQDETGVPVFPVTLAKAAVMTDGKSAEGAIRDAMEKISAVGQSATKMDLLWENASPGGSFGVQTVSIDLSGYDLVLIVYRMYSNRHFSVICDIGVTGEMRNYIYLTGTYLFAAYRNFTVSDTGVEFASGYIDRPQYKETVADNGVGVPRKIYGIKGVRK